MAIYTGGAPSPKDKETLGEGVDSLHHMTKRLLNFGKKRFHDIESFKGMYEESVSDEGTNQENRKQQLFRAYEDLLKHHTEMTEEENLIHRMERKAQIRNTFFRGITTLIIGFSIMFVYFVAMKLEINMPLLRIGM